MSKKTYSSAHMSVHNFFFAYAPALIVLPLLPHARTASLCNPGLVVAMARMAIVCAGKVAVYDHHGKEVIGHRSIQTIFDCPCLRPETPHTVCGEERPSG